MKRILFVCHGNICRSPMAEFMFKQLVREKNVENDFEIASAAVSAEEAGSDMYPPAKSCLRSHGVPFRRHKARLMTAEDYAANDLVLVMDQNNLRRLDGILPAETRNSPDYRDRVRLLMSLAGESRDVADPWYTGDFERTFTDISRALQSLLPD